MIRSAPKNMKGTSSNVSGIVKHFPGGHSDPESRNVSVSVRILVGSFLFLFAFFVRFDGVSTLARQPDESLWLERSTEFVQRIKDPKLRFEATSHLGHPGVPPAVLMGSAIWLGSKLEGKPFDANYNGLYSARLMMVGLASFACILLVLFGTPLVGFVPSVVAALLLALDPRHIGLSQMAHLDTALGTFAIGSILIFGLALKRGSYYLEILGGAIWGLAIATKPTSVVIFPAYILTRVFYHYLFPSRNSRQFSLAPLYSLLAGQVVLAVLCTRFWVHLSDYRGRLGIRTPLARWAWQLGSVLEDYGYLLLGLTAIAVSAAIVFHRQKQNALKWVTHVAALCSSLLLLLSLFPQVFENLFRFWAWVAGLKNENHTSFGVTKPVTPNGYVDLFFAEVPTLVSFSIIAGVLLLAVRFFRGRFERTSAFLALPVLVAFLWVVPLNFSSKQAWRYAIAVMPGLYLLVGVFLCWLTKSIASRVRLPLLQPTLLFVVILLQSYVTFSWRGHHGIFFSFISGGIPAAYARVEGAPFAGQNEVIDFLIQSVKDEPLYVTVIGDSKNLSAILSDRHPKYSSKIRFGYFPPQYADYFLHFASHPHMLPLTGWDEVLASAPAFTYTFRGSELALLHRVPFPKYGEGYSFRFEELHRQTGTKERDHVGRTSLVVEEGRDEKGYLFFTSPVRVKAGVYRARFDFDEGSSSTDSGLEVRFGPCSEFLQKSNGAAEIHCLIPKDGKYPFSGYWSGKGRVRVYQLELRHVGEDE